MLAPRGSSARELGRGAVAVATVLLPGALTFALAFESGGYFPGATALATLVVALVLALRVAAARHPFEGLSGPLGLAAGALMLYAVWTLISSLWSDSPARALLEFDRVLLYLLLLLLFGSLVRVEARVRWMLWGLALGLVAICVVALASRTFPDLFSLAPAVQNERLNHPIGYWNALGLAAALGAIVCLHLTSDEREPAAARILGAAALPVLGATLLFTFSRGPMAAGAVGLVAYVLLARPRLLLTGLLAAGPATAIAVAAAYRADLLATFDTATPGATAQGHDVALVVGLCVLGAAALRALLLALDRLIARIRLSPRARLYVVGAAVSVGVVAAVLAWSDIDPTMRLSEQYDRLKSDRVTQTGDNRDRLTNPGLARLDHWEVATDAFHDAPLKGQGAGTFPLLWAQNRPTDSDSLEAHSLYLETLGELGLVGLALLAATLLTILGGMLARVRGHDRAAWAAVCAATLTWLVHAAVDWDWELPVVTVWLFALGGLALAAPLRPARPRRSPKVLVRAAVVACLLALAVTPVRIALSQDRLTESISLYQRGDCDAARDAARSSISALENRPEPYEVLGYCDVRDGNVRMAPARMREAVERDPENWQFRYSLAVARGAAGLDPRVAAQQALRLNPRGVLAQEAVRRFDSDSRRRWRKAARELASLSFR